MYKKFRDNILIKKMTAPGETVTVALSGGADSVCLLSMMKRLSDDIGISLRAVHVNHMLRGGESDKDENFCQEMCSALNVPLDIYKEDVNLFASQHKMTLEEAGRSVRYNIFSGANTSKIAIAHNMDDNAETFLINLVRGAGAHGLSGIPESPGRYIRPLMIFRKSEILEYCKKNGLEYRTDSSNTDTEYFRNSVRHKLIPLMDELTGRDVTPLLNRTAGMILEDENYLISQCELAFADCITIKESSVEIDNKKISVLHKAIASRVVRKAYEQAEGSLKDFEKKNADSLLEMIDRGNTGESVDLSANTCAIVQFGKTILGTRVKRVDFEYKLKVPGSIYIKERDITIMAETGLEYKSESNSAVYIKTDKIDSLVVRNRRDGDIFEPAKGNGTKKLKKYFIDRKIYRTERNKVFLLVIGGKIAYIEGLDFGKGFVPESGSGYIKVGIERGAEDVR